MEDVKNLPELYPRIVTVNRIHLFLPNNIFSLLVSHPATSIGLNSSTLIHSQRSFALYGLILSVFLSSISRFELILQNLYVSRKR